MNKPETYHSCQALRHTTSSLRLAPPLPPALPPTPHPCQPLLPPCYVSNIPSTFPSWNCSLARMLYPRYLLPHSFQVSVQLSPCQRSFLTNLPKTASTLSSSFLPLTLFCFSPCHSQLSAIVLCLCLFSVSTWAEIFVCLVHHYIPSVCHVQDAQ